jgi:hypothetical protein
MRREREEEEEEEEEEREEEKERNTCVYAQDVLIARRWEIEHHLVCIVIGIHCTQRGTKWLFEVWMQVLGHHIEESLIL